MAANNFFNIRPEDSAMNGEPSQRWIDSLNGEQAMIPTQDSPLPKGEGQGEGEPRSMTGRRIDFLQPRPATLRLQPESPPTTPRVSEKLSRFRIA